MFPKLSLMNRSSDFQPSFVLLKQDFLYWIILFWLTGKNERERLQQSQIPLNTLRPIEEPVSGQYAYILSYQHVNKWQMFDKVSTFIKKVELN